MGMPVHEAGTSEEVPEVVLSLYPSILISADSAAFALGAGFSGFSWALSIEPVWI
jgi:hypothetical protein